MRRPLLLFWALLGVVLLYWVFFSDDKPTKLVKVRACVSIVKADTCACGAYCDDTSDSNKVIFSNPEMMKCAVSQQRPVLGIGGCVFNRANPSSPHLETQYIQLVKQAVLGIVYADWEGHTNGDTWPASAVGGAITMIGLRRLDNLQFLLEEVIRLNIPGDFIETGAWRGGATILGAAIFQAYGQTCPSTACRRVFVADSFQGIPPVDLKLFPGDAEHVGSDQISILRDNSRARVSQSFERLGLLTPSVVWLEGWFKDTLPPLRVAGTRIAVLRLDGDTYESTWQALVELYDLVTPGGFVIVDDYQDWIGCRRAVNEFVATRGLKAKIRPVAHEVGDGAIRGVWWRKKTD